MFITLFIIYKNSDKRKKVLNLLKQKIFLLSSIISLVFSGYIYSLSDDSDDTKKLKHANEQALIAFLIAIFAYLDLKVTPFWLIFLLSYYLHID
jgi:hypothetical protein